MGIPFYSARGLSQVLTPIQQAANAMRDINGTLIDLSDPDFRKYASHIECSDMVGPAVNAVWPGKILTVDCVVELAYLTSGGSPDRTVVSGSSRTHGNFTFYRPQLTMMVLAYETGTGDEWENTPSWSMDLEEV